MTGIFIIFFLAGTVVVSLFTWMLPPSSLMTAFTEFILLRRIGRPQGCFEKTTNPALIAENMYVCCTLYHWS